MAQSGSKPTGAPPRPSMYVAAILAMTIIAGAMIFLINFSLSFFYAMPVMLPDFNAYRKQISDARDEKLDWSTVDETLSKCRAAGCRPFINPVEFRTVPGDVRPVSNRPNSNLLYCNETGKWKFIQSDRYGFANKDPERFAVSDIVLLGDSFGSGACLDDKFSIASNIESHGKSVLSLSVGGHQPLDELATLKEYAPQFKTLVWLFYEGNDFIPAADAESVIRYLKPEFSQNLKSREREILALFDTLEHDWDVRAALRTDQLHSQSWFERLAPDWHSWLERVFSPTVSFLRSFRPPEPLLFQLDVDLFGATLKEGMRAARSKGANRFVVVYLPSWERLNWKPGTHSQISVFDQLRESVSSTSKAAGFEFVDVTPRFSSQKRASLFPYDTRAHYTAAGYKVVSDAILESLEK